VKLSLIIPTFNEQASIAETVQKFHAALAAERIQHEIIVVDDGRDNTPEVLDKLGISEVLYKRNPHKKGFGASIRYGLEIFTGDCAAIVMGDMSDRPEDLVRFYRKMEEGYDCVFGSRFNKGGKTIDYPKYKYVLNRLTNNIIRLLFGIRYNDTTNAFKLYSREVVKGVEPLLSQHFNITVEIPLKAIVRGYSYAVVPNYWTNRKEGESNLKIKEMGSRYFFIILYCLLEKWLSRGDYHKPKTAAPK
jgi:dolichol-phosphate mannosyltransferase